MVLKINLKIKNRAAERKENIHFLGLWNIIYTSEMFYLIIRTSMVVYSSILGRFKLKINDGNSLKFGEFISGLTRGCQF